MPVELKEQYRAEFEDKRHIFEAENHGAYDLLFPCPENPEKQEEYQTF